MNVIVILCDSFRWDCLGHNGNDWIATPRLDEFSRESAIFDNMYTEGLPTLPQRTAAFTGRFTLPFRGWEDMRPDDERLSRILWQHQIYGALVTDSMPMFHVGNGYTEKFQDVRLVRGHNGNPAIPNADEIIDWDLYLPEGRHVNQKEVAGHLRAKCLWKEDEDFPVAKVMKAGMKWIDEYENDEPFMLWLDSFDPHEPWIPPEKYWKKYDPDYDGGLLPVLPFQRNEGFDITDKEEKTLHALYAGTCEMVDVWVGKFLDHLREKGLMDNTMVIFTSDHGEPLGKGKWGHGVYRKFAAWPYDELAHAPMLIRHPEGLGAGQRFSAFCQSCDITATILDGFGIAPTAKMHSRSLLPVLKGETESIRDFAVAGHCRKNASKGSRSLRTHEWSYFYWPDGKQQIPPAQGRIAGAEELYRRSEDPYELNNIIDQHPEVAKDLALTLREWEDDLLAKG